MYDAIVVGARCAGSPLSMLLARMGYRVLLVDRATFPSDTISTQFIWLSGTACLQRWGLLDRLRATNCPPVREVGDRLGPFSLKGIAAASGWRHGNVRPAAYCSRSSCWWTRPGRPGRRSSRHSRSRDCSSSDGRVTGIRGHKRNGAEIEESAKIVIGADGRHSLVASDRGCRGNTTPGP